MRELLRTAKKKSNSRYTFIRTVFHVVSLRGMLFHVWNILRLCRKHWLHTRRWRCNQAKSTEHIQDVNVKQRDGSIRKWELEIVLFAEHISHDVPRIGFQYLIKKQLVGRATGKLEVIFRPHYAYSQIHTKRILESAWDSIF